MVGNWEGINWNRYRMLPGNGVAIEGCRLLFGLGGRWVGWGVVEGGGLAGLFWLIGVSVARGCCGSWIGGRYRVDWLWRFAWCRLLPCVGLAVGGGVCVGVGVGVGVGGSGADSVTGDVFVVEVAKRIGASLVGGAEAWACLTASFSGFVRGGRW